MATRASKPTDYRRHREQHLYNHERCFESLDILRSKLALSSTAGDRRPAFCARYSPLSVRQRLASFHFPRVVRGSCVERVGQQRRVEPACKIIIVRVYERDANEFKFFFKTRHRDRVLYTYGQKFYPRSHLLPVVNDNLRRLPVAN